MRNMWTIYVIFPTKSSIFLNLCTDSSTVIEIVSSLVYGMSRLYHSLEWYTRVYTTRDYGQGRG